MTVMAPSEGYDDTFARLNGETAPIAWRTLQPWFAKGDILVVDAALDLVEVATRLALDDALPVRQWLEAGQLAPASADQARHWFDQDAEVWAVVVLPWILVQNKPSS